VTFWMLALWGTASVATLMLILWAIHLYLKNAAIVDVGWAIGTGGLGVFYAILIPGDLHRRLLVGAMTGIWGLRLGLYLLFTRIIGHEEEGRYRALRREWKDNLPLKFLIFFEFQAVLCTVLSFPFLLSILNPAPRIGWLEWLGAGIWLAGMTGEAIADAQLAAFKRKKASRGHTCQAGLWHYSRHPNYFFEWLIWVGFGLLALAAPHGYLGLVSPALILLFLLRVTGIPATEAQALRTRGEEYRRYQQTTSPFIPWFPKSRPS